MKKLVILIQAVLLAVSLQVSPVFALTVPERLVYDVSWSGITAGTAVQEVSARGDDLRIVNTVRSSGLLSALFSVDDKTESVVRRDSSLPGFFRERINEGNTHSLKEARFDFSSLNVETTDLLGKTGRSDAISGRTYDTLSSLYFIRSAELIPGQSIHFDLYDFKRLWNTEVRVEKREQIRTPLGSFKTLKVTSRLKFQGIFAAAGNVTAWLTDDSRHIPVMIRSKLKVGEVTLILVGGSYRG